MSIEQFCEIISEIATRFYPGIELSSAVDKVMRDMIYKCDSLKLLKKFRAIQDWRREATDSPVLQMMIVENTDLLQRVSLLLTPRHSSKARRRTTPGSK